MNRNYWINWTSSRQRGKFAAMQEVALKYYVGSLWNLWQICESAKILMLHAKRPKVVQLVSECLIQFRKAARANNIELAPELIQNNMKELSS